MSTCLLALLILVNHVADEPKGKLDALRKYYAKTASRCDFYSDPEKNWPIEFVDNAVMRWFNDDGWSGDVFVWTRAARPEVIGCILSGPAGNGSRQVYQEFHLLAEQPVAPALLPNGRRWAPSDGLRPRLIDGAPKPAKSAALRLSQMRELVRNFTADMEADGKWELRLLPQPLIRYQPDEGPVVDGALFTFVWSKGTDPEMIVLVELRKTADGMAWHYAPVRFSSRELWLKYHDTEVWRAAVHREPQGETRMIYTTWHIETIVDPESGDGTNRSTTLK